MSEDEQKPPEFKEPEVSYPLLSSPDQGVDKLAEEVRRAALGARYKQLARYYILCG